MYGGVLGRARCPFYDQRCAARILNNRRGKAAVGGIDRLLQTDEAVVVGTDGDGNRLAVGRKAGGRRKSAGHGAETDRERTLAHRGVPVDRKSTRLNSSH